MSQLFNIAGVRATLRAIVKDRRLYLPHVELPSVANIPFSMLKHRGAKGIILDKDNTLTAPYTKQIPEPILAALAECKKVFGEDKVVVFSNTLGTKWDRDGLKTREFERQFGIRVLRHAKQKPQAIEDVMSEFRDCHPRELVMVGDRYLTDVLFGNLHGMYTIRTSVITQEGENIAPFKWIRCVSKARRIEDRLVQSARASGLRPPPHPFESA